MFTRHLLLPLSLFLVASTALAQTHGGGGHSTGSPSPPPNMNFGATGPGTDIPGFSHATKTTADQEGKIEFRTQTVLVQVPVVVTDKNGNHIHGLSKENFQVLENGKEQTFSTFEELIASSTKLPVVTPKPGEFSNLTLSEQQPRAVTVIALDTNFFGRFPHAEPRSLALQSADTQNVPKYE
jgi:hypothetical protein